MRASDWHEMFPATLQRGAGQQLYLWERQEQCLPWRRRRMGSQMGGKGLGQTWEVGYGTFPPRRGQQEGHSCEPLGTCDQLSASLF